MRRRLMRTQRRAGAGAMAMIVGACLAALPASTRALVSGPKAQAGGLDASFGNGGVVLPADASGLPVVLSTVVVETDGKLVVAGSVQRERAGRGPRRFAFVLLRLDSQGAPDPSF